MCESPQAGPGRICDAVPTKNVGWPSQILTAGRLKRVGAARVSPQGGDGPRALGIVRAKRVGAARVSPQGGDGPRALGIVRAKRVGAEEAPHHR